MARRIYLILAQRLLEQNWISQSLHLACFFYSNTPQLCLFLANLSLIYVGAIGQPKQTTSLSDPTIASQRTINQSIQCIIPIKCKHDLHAMDDVPKFILDISVSDGLDVKRQPTVELKAGLVQQANLLHVAQLYKKNIPLLTKNLTKFFGKSADPGCLSRILIFIHSGSRIQQQHQIFFLFHPFL